MVMVPALALSEIFTFTFSRRVSPLGRLDICHLNSCPFLSGVTGASSSMYCSSGDNSSWIIILVKSNWVSFLASMTKKSASPGKASETENDLVTAPSKPSTLIIIKDSMPGRKRGRNRQKTQMVRPYTKAGLCLEKTGKINRFGTILTWITNWDLLLPVLFWIVPKVTGRLL